MYTHNLDNDRPASLAAEGVRVLKIDVPIYKIEELGSYVRFYLYGGLIVDYPANNLPEAYLDPRQLQSPSRGKPKNRKKTSRRKEG